jgi:colicin import membrane protein
MGASLVVHALLLVALTAGIQWKQDNSLSVEAELWSAVPMAAAPKLVEIEAPPPPPAPKPAPAPKPVVKPPEPAAPNRDAEIAIAKKRKVEEEKKVEAKRDEDKRKEELKKAEEKKAKLKAEEDKRKLETKKEEERKDKERKEKEAKKQQEQKDNKASAEDAKKLDAIRKENMKRIAGLAGASGSENATGTAMKASGPSDSYGGRIRARIKPNITFGDDVVGNPAAEVEVRCAPDGTIVSRKLVKSSGNTAWDNAVLKAIDKTEILPRDTDGRVHSPLLISFRPKD